MSLNYDYQNYFHTGLDEDQWKTMLDLFWHILESIPTGRVLTTKLQYHMDRGKVITIKNYRLGFSGLPSRVSQYPMMSTRTLSVNIPSVPYFVKVRTVENDALDEFISGEMPKNFKTLKQIIDCVPLSKDIVLNPDSIESFTVWKPQPYLVMFAHELIHILRYLEGFDLDKGYEEVSTICGYKNNSLILDNILITENTIRKNLCLPYRIDHDNEDIDVYADARRFSGTVYTYEDFVKY
jgi:hypothetical protein